MEESAAKEAQDATCKDDFASPPYEILIVCHYPKQHGQDKAGVSSGYDDCLRSLQIGLFCNNLQMDFLDSCISLVFFRAYCRYIVLVL
jgi:hypothetical protein